MRKIILPILVALGVLTLQSCSKKENPAIPKNGPQQRDNWISGQTIVNGTYKLLYPSGTRGISVIGESAANSAYLEIRDHDPERNARNWTITSLGSGYYKIINVKSGKAIDVPLGQTTLGLQIWQYTYNGDNAQIWKIEFIAGSGNLYKITNKLTNLVLTRTAGGTATGPLLPKTPITAPTTGKNGTCSRLFTAILWLPTFLNAPRGWLNSDGGGYYPA